MVNTLWKNKLLLCSNQNWLKTCIQTLYLYGMGTHWISLTYVVHEDVTSIQIWKHKNGWHVIIFYIKQWRCTFSQTTNDISLKRFPILMMSPKTFYDISIMFHIDAMICHGHLAKMEWVEFKATHSDGCKRFISRCQSNQWWIDVFSIYLYGWVDNLIWLCCSFPRFHFLDFHGLLLLAFLNILLLLFFAFVFLFMN
jgi:hypothetical protein